MIERVGGRERARRVGRVQHLRGRVGARLQRGQAVEHAPVGAVQPHDLRRAEDPPVVQRRVVAEPRQRVERGRVVVGRGVEVQLHVGHRVAAVVLVEHVLQVADPHVVGLDREVGAPEALLGEPQIANRRGERQTLVEAIVDLRALALQPGHLAELAVPGGAGDLRRQLPAAGEVDVHPQQRLAGLREDLSDPSGVGGVVAGDHVVAAGALDEHERLDHVRVHAGAGRGGVDQRPQRRHPGRGREHAARALGEQHVRAAGHGASLEVGSGARTRTRTGRPPWADGRRREAAGADDSRRWLRRRSRRSQAQGRRRRAPGACGEPAPLCGRPAAVHKPSPQTLRGAAGAGGGPHAAPLGACRLSSGARGPRHPQGLV